MAKCAQGYVTCRKITSDQSCGICDNCTGPQESVHIKNIRPVAEAIVRLCMLLKDLNERVTMAKLVQMVQGRGLGIAKTRVQQDDRIQIPIDKTYTEYDIERILNHLISEGYLREDFLFTPYSTITYIVTGQFAKDALRNSGRAIELAFLSTEDKPTNKKRKVEYICLD
ncbi:hypothetical protein CU098_013197 [Rhizopus stolonifer]|uniref:Uncharacterized protein n=1 Tax=Rhizopus stolonifer TaxID=4846 RepID=A0A367KU33_RHIST|nr:hypothetical protein CU098_013197 [Rhizopus stolonifer]